MAQAKRKKTLDHTKGTAGDPESANRSVPVVAAMAFEVYTPVRLDQLDAEMVEASNWRKSASLSADGSLDSPSVAKPAVIFVGHESADEGALLKVISAHVADPDWTPKGETVATPTFKDVHAHAKAGVDLTPAEIQVALRHLLKT